MANLLLHQGDRKQNIEFDPKSSPLLAELLSLHHAPMDHPCGRRGICKKCAVRLKDADGERQALSCCTRLTKDCEVWLTDNTAHWSIEGADTEDVVTTDAALPLSGKSADTSSLSSAQPSDSYGIACDIGTTTVVLCLYDRKTGTLLASAAMPNPQRETAADVMGRIQAAGEGKADSLQEMISEALAALTKEACRKAGTEPARVTDAVITGNTTMLSLLTGTDTASMGRSPFLMNDAFGREVSLPLLHAMTRSPAFCAAYLPGCMHAFVGADITCAVLASGLTQKTGTALLADIGTNGELALRKNGKLYVTSTAAGPAFEGAGIVCGCGSIEGAIDHVSVKNGKPVIHTIGDAKAAGLCGSGLIDAVAAGLSLECISETGVLEEPFVLAEDVALYPEDVRSLQLAKAAVCAGIRTLLEVSGTDYEEIETFFIAGGFGSHLDISCAVSVGLFPEELTEKAVPIGNAALSGAAGLLLEPGLRANEKRITERSEHVSLGGNPLFNDYYMECMLFGEE